jgi:hypothetical protein
MEDNEELKQAEARLERGEADLVAAEALEHAAENEIKEAIEEIRESKKTDTIIVNGTPHEWPKGDITYAQVVTLDVPDYPKRPEITYSVKYKSGHGTKPEGTLSPGGSVKVKNGEIFSVSPTGQS